MIAAALWWVYFEYAADAVRHALATAQVQLDIARLVLSYGHLSFIAAIVATAVGMHDAVAHPTEPLGGDDTALLLGGTALYLATFGSTRWVMFRLISWTRLSAATGVLVLGALTRSLPTLGVLTLLAVLLVALNVVERARVEQIGWRARLAGRRETAAQTSTASPTATRE